MPDPVRIVHAVDISGPHCARVEKARISWGPIYEKEGVTPIHVSTYPRDAQKDLGDKRPLPYLRDLLAVAMEVCERDEDIILWGNSDIALKQGIGTILREHIDLHQSASMRRTESNGHGHPGRDLFAFTRRWLNEHWTALPDYLLGAPVFDLGLTAMIRKHHKLPCDLRSMPKDLHPAEMTSGYALHESHEPAWQVHKKDIPSTTHNRTLFRKWASEHAPELRFNRDNNLR